MLAGICPKVDVGKLGDQDKMAARFRLAPNVDILYARALDRQDSRKPLLRNKRMERLRSPGGPVVAHGGQFVLMDSVVIEDDRISGQIELPDVLVAMHRVIPGPRGAGTKFNLKAGFLRNGLAPAVGGRFEV